VNKIYVQDNENPNSTSNKSLKTREFYSEKLIDYFKNHSKYRPIAINECFLKYKELNKKREMLELLSSQESKNYIRGGLRAMAYDVFN
jgi:hypothetical protein